MYENLIETLRFCAKDGDCHNCPYEKPCAGTFGDGLYCEAAEAIEELSKQLDDMNEANIALYGALPHWIPVSERLPEAESGDTSKPVLVTDGDCMAIAELFNFELCEPYWSYTGIGDITHWMPLPEPPKEET